MSRPSAGHRRRISTPGLTACFEALNRSTPPVPCSFMMRTAFCATDWWREEIELEALAQQRVVDLADLAFPGSSGIGDEDIDAAIDGDRLVEGGTDVGGIGDVGADADRIVAGLLGGIGGLCGVEIDDDDMRAVLGEELCGRRADSAGAAGHQHDLAGAAAWACWRRAWPAPATSIRAGRGQPSDSGRKSPIASAPRTASIHISPTSDAILRFLESCGRGRTCRRPARG